MQDFLPILWTELSLVWPDGPLQVSPEPDPAPPHTLQQWQQEAAAQHHPHRHAGSSFPVEDGIDVGVTGHGTGGVKEAQFGVLRQLLTLLEAEASTPRSPVDSGEYRVVDTKDDGQVEVVDADGSGRNHDVDHTGDGVYAVEEDIQYLHPSSCVLMMR